jgi:hypothetical protein
VRGWLRAFAARAAALREHFVRRAPALDPGHDRRCVGGSDFFDAVDAGTAPQDCGDRSGRRVILGVLAGDESYDP